MCDLIKTPPIISLFFFSHNTHAHAVLTHQSQHDPISNSLTRLQNLQTQQSPQAKINSSARGYRELVCICVCVCVSVAVGAALRRTLPRGARNLFGQLLNVLVPPRCLGKPCSHCIFYKLASVVYQALSLIPGLSPRLLSVGEPWVGLERPEKLLEGSSEEKWKKSKTINLRITGNFYP